MPELQTDPMTLRVSQVAKLLGVARSTVYLWVKDGVLSACQIGKVVLVPTQELEAFVQRHRISKNTNKTVPTKRHNL